jgi:hypothetical protein
MLFFTIALYKDHFDVCFTNAGDTVLQSEGMFLAGTVEFMHLRTAQQQKLCFFHWSMCVLHVQRYNCNNFRVDVQCTVYIACICRSTVKKTPPLHILKSKKAFLQCFRNGGGGGQKSQPV